MTKSTGKKQVGSLVGVRFTYLLVLAKDDVRSTKSGNYYECLCDCGIVKSVLAAKLNNGNTRSCGCFKAKLSSEKLTQHGLRHSRTYSAWANMKNRCNRSDDKASKHYKDRGITYTQEWEKFQGFLDDMGVCPDNLTLERVDVDGNYEKSNCRWDTRSVQTHNRRKISCKNPEVYSSKIGVSWSLTSKKWMAKLVKDGVVVLRERFVDELEAAIAYDDASELHYGDRPNNTRSEHGSD